MFTKQRARTRQIVMPTLQRDEFTTRIAALDQRVGDHHAS